MFATRRALGAARQEAAASRVRVQELEMALADLLGAVNNLPDRVEVRLSTEGRALANAGHPVGLRYRPIQVARFMARVAAAARVLGGVRPR